MLILYCQSKSFRSPSPMFPAHNSVPVQCSMDILLTSFWVCFSLFECVYSSSCQFYGEIKMCISLHERHLSVASDISRIYDYERYLKIRVPAGTNPVCLPAKVVWWNNRWWEGELFFIDDGMKSITTQFIREANWQITLIPLKQSTNNFTQCKILQLYH